VTAAAGPGTEHVHGVLRSLFEKGILII